MWQLTLTPDDLNARSAGTIASVLGIEITRIEPDALVASMPVDGRTRQPAGLLHGGASVVLAETLGSIASMMVAPPPKRCVGIEVNANHVRGVKSGLVHGVVRPLHLGRSTHVWDIRITDDAGELVSVARLTVAVIG